MINQGKRRIIIRIGQRHLSFSALNLMQTEQPITYEPYVVKSGMSLPANLREALGDADLPQMGIRRALVMLDTQVLLVPIEQFEEASMAEMFNHAFPKKEMETVLFNVLTDLNVVAVFGVNKDLHTVLRDNFDDVQITPAMAPVWRHLHRRSFTGSRSKLYGYFHDHKLDIFSFHQNRFKFCNQFDTQRPQDAIYFLLYVWKQQLLNPENDEMHLIGDGFSNEAQTELINQLRKYVQKVYVINPSAEFNRAPVTKIKGMPFDLMTLFMKGR